MSDSVVFVNVKPIHPTTPKNSVHNGADCVRVGCDYDKGCKEVSLSAYPAERKDGAVSIIITSGQYAPVEPMTRLNRKRLDVLQSAMRNQVSMRIGQAWALVLAVCEKHGYEVVDPDAPPTLKVVGE